MADNETNFIGISEILAVGLSEVREPGLIVIITKDTEFTTQRFTINPLGISGKFTRWERFKHEQLKP